MTNQPLTYEQIWGEPIKQSQPDGTEERDLLDECQMIKKKIEDEQLLKKFFENFIAD
jgi:hypothetical protein